jgi:hypothetical protein
LQSYIVSLAERAGAPVVEMFDLDSTLQQIAAIVVAKALAKAQARAEVEPEPEGADAESAGGSGQEGRLVGSRIPGRVPRLKSWELLGARRKG